MNMLSVSIDHFGIAGDPLVQRLLNQSSDKRARKLAFNNLFRFAKASGLIAREAIPCKVEIAVDKAGCQHLQFVYSFPGAKT